MVDWAEKIKIKEGDRFENIEIIENLPDVWK